MTKSKSGSRNQSKYGTEKTFALQNGESQISLKFSNVVKTYNKGVHSTNQGLAIIQEMVGIINTELDGKMEVAVLTHDQTDDQAAKPNRYDITLTIKQISQTTI